MPGREQSAVATGLSSASWRSSMSAQTGAQHPRVRVALVGHCGPDQWALRSAVGSALPGAEFVSINDEQTLQSSLGALDLALVNRVLDGRFPSESGIELIGRFASKAQPRPALLLISNFPDAQRDAEAAGAAPGFGKADANTETARSRLRNAAGAIA